MFFSVSSVMRPPGISNDIEATQKGIFPDSKRTNSLRANIKKRPYFISPYDSTRVTYVSPINSSTLEKSSAVSGLATRGYAGGADTACGAAVGTCASAGGGGGGGGG